MPRREFTKAVSAEIVKRATRLIDDSGVKAQFCEECSALAKRFEIDHIKADALEVDKSKKLTAAQGRLLCIPCHKEKTKIDKGVIAEAVRREGHHLGAVKPKGTIPHQKKEKAPPRPVANGLPNITRRFADA